MVIDYAVGDIFFESDGVASGGRLCRRGETEPAGARMVKRAGQPRSRDQSNNWRCWVSVCGAAKGPITSIPVPILDTSSCIRCALTAD